MDTATPTAEWLSRYDYEPPTLDQKVACPAFRRISQIEKMRKRKDISYEQFRAAEKLNTHRLGAMGVKVGQGEDTGLNADTEYPITYHNQKIDIARDAIGNARMWHDLMCVVEESRTLVQIGTSPRRMSHAVARAYALGRIATALDTLVDLWGLTTRRKNVP